MPSRSAQATPKPFVFVLMPFSPDFDNVYKIGIRDAAKKAGAYAERIDEMIFTEGILDKLFVQIDKADVIVADMTDRNPNVFYEVGYAHALGKIVLLLTQNAEDIPFDLKHRHHLVYEERKLDDLREKLAKRIAWAVAESKKKGSSAETPWVYANGQVLPEKGEQQKPPTIQIRMRYSSSDFFHISFAVHNRSAQAFAGATHLYTLSGEDSVVVPCTTALKKIRSVRPPSQEEAFRHGEEIEVEVPDYHRLEPIRLPKDAVADDMILQYKLSVALPALPPGAVDQLWIPFQLNEDQLRYRRLEEVESPLRFRIQTSLNFYDFDFLLRFEY